MSKEFKPTSWAIGNKTSIYILTVIITLGGIMAYMGLAKERFPEIIIPTIYVSTFYPGTSPSDMENLVTRPIEKQIKSVTGVKKVTSNSVQDFANVIVEFNTGINVSDAKQKIKDAVDKARNDLPTDLPKDPIVQEIDFSEIPIMFVNMSGDFELDKLKKYADEAKDRIEQMKEVTRVDIVGALEREVQIDVDMFKMQAAKITPYDIEQGIGRENVAISGGNIRMGNMKRTIRVVGSFIKIKEIGDIVIRNSSGAPVYLKEIAEVKDAYKEKESYARLDKKNVITLNIIKRSGENLIEASDKVNEVLKKLEKEKFPSSLRVTITGDQSTLTRHTLDDLINSIIIGFVLVTLVLMFFMGVTNAIFVALSVPLSMCLAFMVMPGIGFTLNMIVLFSFLFALGIVVDDAMVVIENTHRLFNNGKMNIVKAAKMATGEVFLPVLSGTLTTLAPFVPLIFWPGVVGKFMHFLPITLIITLLASLVIAYILNPVFAVSFMKPEFQHNEDKVKTRKSFIITSIVFALLAILFYVSGGLGMGNFIVFIYLLVVFYKIALKRIIAHFQNKTLPALMTRYENLLRWSLKGAHPYLLLGSTILLLFFTFFLTGVAGPKVVFFPQGEPNFVYVYITLPVGTDQEVTDSITKIVENRVYSILGPENKIVESVISNVAIGAGDPMDGDRSISPNKGKVTVAFKEFGERNGVSTSNYLDLIREKMKGIPGAEITVDQEKGGPPTGKPVNIEVYGDEFKDLTSQSYALKHYLDSLQIPGVEEIKSDIQASKPEIIVEIDRERANREGISTGQLGMEIRTAVFGKEISKFREFEDDYPIQLRYAVNQRSNIDALMNLKITYRDMATGGSIRQIPLASVANIKYENSYGGIKRKNLKRMVTLSSNVLSGFTPNEVVGKVTAAISKFKAKEGIEIKMTGESEDQKESSNFLSMAMLVSLGLIFLILVTQFNSIGKTVIILTQVVFSIIGVLIGFIIFKMQISIVMTGMGIVALAGIVVRNGILLVEFTDVLRSRKVRTKEAIIKAGRTRITPVLLTASATILGLVPLAIGFNIDFVKMFTEFNPHIYFGGDSVVFWGPLSWTLIFGLSFATFLTLILVPVMYFIFYGTQIKMKRWMWNTLKINTYGAPKDRSISNTLENADNTHE